MPRRTHKTADLRAIAGYQKVLILCLLGQIFVWLGGIAAMMLGEEMLAYMVMVLAGLVVLATPVFVMLLGVKVSGATVGVFLGLLALIPCLGLIMILVLNSQTTSLLQANGVRVGLFGARMRDIAERSDDGLGGREEDDDDDRPRRRRDEIDEEEGW